MMEVKNRQAGIPAVSGRFMNQFNRGGGFMAGAADNQGLGRLRGDVTVTIQTRQAQTLLTGRDATPERKGVMGLMRFSRNLSQITAAAKADDPWADWYLVQVEERLEAAEKTLVAMKADMQAVLQANPLMDVRVSESVKPLQVTVGFSSPHAYWIARVITELDTLVRMILTAQHVALMVTTEAHRRMDAASVLIRRVFESTDRYRATGLTRDDVASDLAQVQEAMQKMGAVPEDVLNGSRRAKFAPALPPKAERELEAVAAVGSAESAS
ncbi:MAG TPA: TIGR03761 family integrating conjugative element protein [Candidatus Thiothrix moscowensis]|uniref:PFL_4669 family integrating conjugative element protein n=1 Tax=unclassified Thiothrix TaxID=2636184 RepID=UPI0025E82DA2|nr:MULTISPECIES: TIGR03761 family integrating conjugative element protein [unclassified Thiothrix]HRJ54292.1 TIGR03761 family integrating conjugative element protein [Candidatus Thiothrix moscowensis]HRJ94520.1 TIGR03761 family integrating conjugative element protein [Candidatus Thiothrix moscowensis]